MVAPAGRFRVSLMSPEPDGVLPVAPPAAALVQLTFVSCAEKASVTVALAAVLGPPLLTTIVYVTGPPGAAEVTPSVLVMARSTRGTRVSKSVALLLARFVSVVPA